MGHLPPSFYLLPSTSAWSKTQAQLGPRLGPRHKLMSLWHAKCVCNFSFHGRLGTCTH